jgi:hypothetical protein
MSNSVESDEVYWERDTPNNIGPKMILRNVSGTQFRNNR